VDAEQPLEAWLKVMEKEWVGLLDV